MAISDIDRRLFAALLAGVPALALFGQDPPADFICPMDPDVHAKGPGKCPKCGMKLEARIPEPVAYWLDLTVDPPQAPAGQPLDLSFRIRDPKTGAPVKAFEIVHEKYFHFFAISADLEFFAHEHPQLGEDGVFHHRITLPKAGHYRFISDLYPSGGTPQLISKIVTTAGYRKPLQESCAHLATDLAPKKAENLEVALTMEPEQPIAGKKTLLFFHLKPDDGLETYLGAWAHMLIASNDLIDADHTHPSIANGGPELQFNVFFPREATYRVWVQFQRLGTVNTVAFTIPVTALK